MKITAVKTQIVELPADDPLGNSPVAPGTKRPFVTVSVETDQGIEGIAVTFFGGLLTKALRQAIDALGALALGEDPLRHEAVMRKLQDVSGHAGPGGVLTLAQSTLDIALWDIKGKAFETPLWKLLGGARERVPTYASGALMRSLTLDQAVASAQRLVKSGFREVKMQLALPGRTSPRIEVERARALRAAVGPDVKLMVDINQRWRVEQAIEIGRRIEDLHLGWLEDVTAADDFPGLARVTDALATPVAGGEYVWGVVPFRHMLEARSVDIVMIDLMRVGGITQWVKVAGMAEAFNLPVVSHLIPEVHVHLIAAIPHGLTVEYMPWTIKLFEDPPLPQKGELSAPTRPGLGLAFDKKTLKRYRVD